MDFLEDLFERREGRRGGRNNNHNHEDDRDRERMAPPGSKNRRQNHEEEEDGQGRGWHQGGQYGHDEDEGWGRGDAHSSLLRWREHLRQPMVRVGLAVTAILLLLVCAGILVLAWPWLAKAAAYVNQHGIQGVLESLQGTGNRFWKGSG